MPHWVKTGRTDEKIGGGFFVFRRGDGTGRIRPPANGSYPFEHATFDAAAAEADRLAKLHPGYRFDVLAVVASRLTEKPPAAPVDSIAEMA